MAVQIKDHPIYSDENDTYWNFYNESGAIIPPPHQIWCCKDTYFLPDVNGLQYFGCNSPPNSPDLQAHFRRFAPFIRDLQLSRYQIFYENLIKIFL